MATESFGLDDPVDMILFRLREDWVAVCFMVWPFSDGTTRSYQIASQPEYGPPQKRRREDQRGCHFTLEPATARQAIGCDILVGLPAPIRLFASQHCPVGARTWDSRVHPAKRLAIKAPKTDMAALEEFLGELPKAGN